MTKISLLKVAPSVEKSVRRSVRFPVCVLLAALPIAGCKKTNRIDPEVDGLGRAVGPVEPGAAVGEGSPVKIAVRGRVLEKIEVTRYVYLKIDGRDGDVWTAVPKIGRIPDVGADAGVDGSLVMRDFKSPSMGRVFPEVVFGVLAGTGKDTLSGP